ncbi:hypothetical protein DYU11_09870 [Fibrisoma montanum]|uniref:Uncharacterized protein n=1 Tax=Fibrisoma montanum TaxID=2305895 RepID=A0A418MFM8_9BACT|nr:hypothetical protein [Fibrisoma montanum]RIV25586.1 hypothetical protein DYU11_09870 [Fibrisoma montanum]
MGKKKIILANIGNRNLTYKGKTLIPDTRPTEPPSSFREQTKALLDEYDTVREDLNEQILTVLLNDIGVEQIDYVVLFASDNQIAGDRNDQDTIHEAAILKRLLADRMNLVAEVVPYTGNVTHNDDLLRFYRDALRPYQQTEHDLVVCDAGGTAQQKSALKIGAEYLLPPDRYTVRYVLPSGRVTPVEQVEYRRIIDEEQVAALVEHGQYAGAMAIYSAINRRDEIVERLIRFADLRVKSLWADARKELSASVMALLPFLKQFGSGKPSGNYAQFAPFFKEQAFFLLCERFEIAQNAWRLRDYSGAVLNFQIFQETFLNTFITSFGAYDLVGNYYNACTKLIEDLTNDQSPIVGLFGGSLKQGVPLTIRYAQSLAHNAAAIQRLFNWFEQSNAVLNGTRKGTDSLRNNIAHNGKGVDEKLLLSVFPAFDQMLIDIQYTLGIPSASSFVIVDKLITNRLRQ